MKFFQITLMLIFAVVLAACTSTRQASSEPKGIAAFANDERLGEAVKQICFNRGIDGFYNATRDTVVLSKGVSDDYIVEVSGLCTNLRNAKSIAIDSTLSCVTRGDILLVSTSTFSLDDGTGIGPDRCFIDKIHKWNKKAKPSAEQDIGSE